MILGKDEKNCVGHGSLRDGWGQLESCHCHHPDCATEESSPLFGSRESPHFPDHDGVWNSSGGLMICVTDR